MVKRPLLIASSKSFVGFLKIADVRALPMETFAPAAKLSSGRRSMLGWLLDTRQVEDRLAEQAVNRIRLPGFGLDEQRPILVRLDFVSGHVFLPKFGGASSVLDDELAIHDGPNQRIGRAH